MVDDIEAVLSDPERLGEAIKRELSVEKRDFLDDLLIDFLRGYLKAKAKLEINHA
jgi:hypothetical protein